MSTVPLVMTSAVSGNMAPGKLCARPDQVPDWFCGGATKCFALAFQPWPLGSGVTWRAMALEESSPAAITVITEAVTRLERMDSPLSDCLIGLDESTPRTAG